MYDISFKIKKLDPLPPYHQLNFNFFRINVLHQSAHASKCFCNLKLLWLYRHLKIVNPSYCQRTKKKKRKRKSRKKVKIVLFDTRKSWTNFAACLHIVCNVARNISMLWFWKWSYQIKYLKEQVGQSYHKTHIRIMYVHSRYSNPIAETATPTRCANHSNKNACWYKTFCETSQSNLYLSP